MTRYVPFHSRSLILAILMVIAISDKALSDTVIYVDNQNPSAFDSNSGTKDSPLKTLKMAVQRAETSNKNNVPVTVIVRAGTYRESVALNASSTSKPAPMVFQAEPLGSVIVSGSDIWTGWKRQGTTNIYTHNWTFNWGSPSRGTSHPPIVGRREMVFVNGVLLTQVMSSSELKDESFYVDESADTLYIRTKANVDSAKIEVAIRAGLFLINSRQNVSIKGFVFQHDASANDASAVRIVKPTNLLIEDCNFLWNGWGGLSINTFDNATVRRTVANHNGGRGTEVVRGTNLLMEDNETSYNNWRGYSGGYTGWNVAGAKHLKIHGAVYKNHISIDNKARGFWLDYDNQNITFDGLVLLDNIEAGIGVEANQGPIVIKNSVACGNTVYGGIISSNSENVTVQDSVIYNNFHSQLRWYGASHSRPVTNWETGKTNNLYAKNWTVKGNIIAGTTSEHQLLMNVTDSPADGFINTLSANNNIYWNPVVNKGFRANGDSDFNGWKSKTRQDGSSIFTDPKKVSLTSKQKELLDVCMRQDAFIFSVTASTPTHDSAEITWSTSGPSNSRVEYGPTQSYGGLSAVDTNLVTHHKILLTGLNASTTYHFRVLSRDQSGNSYVSNDFTFTTPQFTDNDAPTIPTVLTAIVISSSQINLSWGASTDNVGVTGYRIYRNGTAITTTTETFYSDTGLTQSTKYTYTVSAFDAAGNQSGHSLQASATTYAEPSGSPPDAPSNLKVNPKP